MEMFSIVFTMVGLIVLALVGLAFLPMLPFVFFGFVVHDDLAAIGAFVIGAPLTFAWWEFIDAIATAKPAPLQPVKPVELSREETPDEKRRSRWVVVATIGVLVVCITVLGIAVSYSDDASRKDALTHPLSSLPETPDTGEVRDVHGNLCMPSQRIEQSTGEWLCPSK